MNGIHDMGGMHGMGPIRREPKEPVFHEPWEGRVFALNAAMAAWGKWNIDAGRYQVELLPPADYLRLSYYAQRFVRLIELMITRDLVTRQEVESGRPVSGSPKTQPPLTAEGVSSRVRSGVPTSRDAPVTPRFKVHQRVRARTMHPVGHTRLPRYVRGKIGTIERDHGVYVFPDTNALFRGENPQHVYSVRFDARALWGDQASPRDSVYLDLWDEYLEQA